MTDNTPRDKTEQSIINTAYVKYGAAAAIGAALGLLYARVERVLANTEVDQ